MAQRGNEKLLLSGCVRIEIPAEPSSAVENTHRNPLSDDELALRLGEHFFGGGGSR